MGRYYSGDINGKFMFAIQSSTAADRFGSTHMQPGHVNYFFDESDLETINSELEKLKINFDICNKFIEDIKKSNRTGYTSQDKKENGITDEKMSDYSDYVLGAKIKKCIEENGECSFEAEL